MQTISQQSQNFIKNFADLKTLEQSIAKGLGNQILDYIYLFSPDSGLDISLPDLNPGTRELLTRYISTADKILTAYAVPRNKEPELAADFIETLRDIYQLRFIIAKKIYAEYQLTRVPTISEANLMNSWEIKEMPVNFSINITDALLYDEQGDFLARETIAQENREHIIKSYLSAYPGIFKLKEKMLEDLIEITTRGMVPRMYRNEILDLCEQLALEMTSYLCKKTYEYLARGFNPDDAKANVSSFYHNLLAKQNNQFKPAMEDLEKTLLEIIKNGLSKIKILEPETITDLTTELLDLIKYYFVNENLLPLNYYRIEFRPAVKGVKKQVMFLDSYLIFDNGEVSSQPVETYKVELSDEAKAMIFDYVTNGLDNPNFTLEDYLATT